MKAKKLSIMMLVFLFGFILNGAHVLGDDVAEENHNNKKLEPIISTYLNKWSVISKTKQAPQIDGDLNDKAWKSATVLSGFLTPYFNKQSDDNTEVKMTFNDKYVFFSLTSDNKEKTLANFEILLKPEQNKNTYYRIPLKIKDVQSKYVNDWGPNITTVNPVKSQVKETSETITAEMAISLHSINIDEIVPGEEWSFNAIVQHELNSSPMSSWIPIQTSSIHYTGGNANAYGSVTNEGRAGSIFMGELPENKKFSQPLVAWDPEQFSLQYKSFSEKELSFKRQDLNPKKTNIHLKWRAPSGSWESLDDPEVQKSKEQLVVSFTHPAPLENGLYQLQIIAERDNKSPRISIITFDRKNLIDAGDKSYKEKDSIQDKRKVSLEEPSDEVEDLLKFIPENTGFIFAGLPDQPELSPQNLYDWDPDFPNQLSSKYSDLTYPNEQFPENKKITVKNGKGETVEYPYYEDENNKRYFFTAHIWYKQKDYVLGQIKRVANEDPLGAARLIHRFAEVYEGWVPTNDYPWNNQPIAPSTGPPYHWWGGKWYRWSAAEFFNFRPLVEAYQIVNQTNAFEVLSQQIGENVHQKIMTDLFEPTIEFYHTFPVLYHNMEDNNALGLIALGNAVNDPKYIHEAVEWSENFVMNTYLFDGFFKETSISYHNQSTDGVNKVIHALNGWSDPQGYISPRSGLNLENLNMKDKFPVLQKSSEIPEKLVYPNGSVMPTQDTWAFEKPTTPNLDAGSFLLPASGISRMQKDQTQLNLTFQPKYGHHHLDPLNLTLFSKGQELIPDIGYTHTLYRRWTESTLSHNTVVVDGEDMNLTDQSHHGGNIEVFATENDRIQVTRASQETAYSQTEEYLREPWLIEFPDSENGDGYVLDLFRVSGGDRHEYTLQGDANHDAAFESDLPFSHYGPYLLPDGVQVEEPEGERDYGSAEGHYYGYIYVRDVEKAVLTDEKYNLTLVTKDEDEEKAKVNITGLVDQGNHELFIGNSPSLRATRLHGKSMDTNIEAVKYMMPKMVLRKEGTNLTSQFITAIEPYNNHEEPRIQNVKKLKIDEGSEGDIAVQITYGNRTDIILSSVKPDIPLVVDDMTLEGKMGIIRLIDDHVDEIQLIGGTFIQKGEIEVTDHGSVSGEITDVLRMDEGESQNAFVTETKVPQDMVGHIIVITHPDGKTHGYRIKNINRADEKTWIETDEMDPGFTIRENNYSEMKFYPFTEWNGKTTFQIENNTQLNEFHKY